MIFKNYKNLHKYNNMQKVFFLADSFDNQIVTRNSMKLFLDKLSRAFSKEIVLDFKDISFISRSCADEYIKWKVITSKNKITEVNMNDDVRMMFKLVSLQYKRNNILTA